MFAFEYLTAKTALSKAKARQIHGRLSLLEKLPQELKNMVLSNCDPTSAINLAMSGPDFYESLKRHESVIAVNIVINNVGSDLLLLAVRCFLAKDLSHRRFFRPDEAERAMQDAQALLDTMLTCPGKAEFTMETAQKFMSFHICVTQYAHVLSTHALGVCNGYYGERPIHAEYKEIPEFVAVISKRELRRFIKALYILQLTCYLFPRDRLCFRNYFVQERGSYRESFWLQFAPWEQQQVRCADEILAAYLSKRIKIEAPRVNESEFPPLLVKQFIFHEGLEAIRHYESEGTLSRLMSSFSWEVNVARGIFPSQPWYSHNDMPWLKKNYDTFQISMDVEHILAKFQEEEDSGPRDSWFHTLLFPLDLVQNRLSDLGNLFGVTAEFYVGQGINHNNGIATSGHAFWDREKLDWQAWGRLPPAEWLTQKSRDTWIHVDDYLYKTRGREIPEWLQ